MTDTALVPITGSYVEIAEDLSDSIKCDGPSCAIQAKYSMSFPVRCNCVFFACQAHLEKEKTLPRGNWTCRVCEEEQVLSGDDVHADLL